MRRFILPPVVILCLLALSSLSPGSGARALSVQTATITPIPGGTWINPGNQFVVTGTTLHFAAHAYPTNSGDPKIDHVNFTATWPGAAWRVACAVSQPSHDNVFECDWNLAQAGVPNGGSGALTVSFDVYDTSGDYNLAPNGLHQEENWTASMRNWRVTGYESGQGDHVGRDYWAVDLVSNNTAVYPARPGTVVYAQWNCQTTPGQQNCYGNVVVIDHGNGLYTIYAHLAASGLPQVGQSVGVNNQIGTMSDSGCPGCGAHLHFAARSGPGNLGADALFGSNTPVRTPW
jgi:hypothetical protein